MVRFSKILSFSTIICFAVIHTGCITVKHMDSLNEMPVSRTYGTLIKHSKDQAVLWGGIENNAAMADPNHKMNPQLDLKYGSWSYLYEPYPPSTFHFTIERHQNKTIIFGGKNKNEEYYNQIWFFDKKWQKLKTKIEGRVYASSCIHGNKVVVFGGQNSKGIKLHDGLTFDFTTKDLKYFTIDIPGLRSHRMNCHKDKWVITGGRKQKGFNADVYIINSKNQTLIKRLKNQTPRLGHATSIFKNSLYVLGGREKAGRIHGDLSKLNLSTYRWKKLQNPVFTPQTDMIEVTYDDHWFLMHGRSQPATGHNEVIIFDFKQERWLKPQRSCTSPRFSVASLQDRHLLYLLSGFGSNSFLNDGCMIDLRQFTPNHKPSS